MFTENQVRQLYVVGSVPESGTHVTKSSDAGATELKKTADEKEIYFVHKGATEDGLQRTDIVNLCNVTRIAATDADDMKHLLKTVEVTLDSNVSATAVVGQDYVLNVSIKNYIAVGHDSTKEKFAVARAFSTTASDLYKALAINLAKNFSREPAKLIKITLKGDAASTEITSATKASDLSTITATGIIIQEVEQPWRRGAAPVEYVNFEVSASVITVNNTERVWGKATDVTATANATLVNSKKVADMEWFFHKERGDVYGEVGFPNNIDTTYMVVPSNADGYSMLDINFYAEGNSINVGHSEKTITLVGTKTYLNTLLTALTTALNGYKYKLVKSDSWD